MSMAEAGDAPDMLALAYFKFGSAEVDELVRLPVPGPPGPNQLLVKVLLCTSDYCNWSNFVRTGPRC